MNISQICSNLYFGLQAIAKISENTLKVNALVIVKFLSYTTLALGGAYLSFRAFKRNPPTPQDKTISEIAKSLYASNKATTEELNNFFDKLTDEDKNGLTELNFTNTEVNDQILQRLQELAPNLEHIDLSHTRVTSEGLLSLSYLPKLTDLTYDYNSASQDPEFEALSRLASLKSLSLKGYTKDFVGHFHKLPLLEKLSLRNTTIRTLSLNSLFSLKNLQELDLVRTGCSTHDIDNLGLHKSLKVVHLTDSYENRHRFRLLPRHIKWRLVSI